MTEDDYVIVGSFLGVLVLTICYFSYCQGYHVGYKAGFLKGYHH